MNEPRGRVSETWKRVSQDSSSFLFFRKCLADWRAPTNRSTCSPQPLTQPAQAFGSSIPGGDHEVPRDFYTDTDYFAPVIIGQPYLSMNLDKLQTIRAAGCGANESLWNDNCDRIVPRRLSAFPTKFCFHESLSMVFDFFLGIVRGKFTFEFSVIDFGRCID